MKKTFTLSLALALCLTASADELKIFSAGFGAPTVSDPQLMGLGISPNGKYICGAIEMGVGIFVADNESGDVNWIILDASDGGELRNVDNNGLAIGVADDGIFFSIDDAEDTAISVPQGYRYFLGESLTNDGSMIIGSLVGSAFDTKACYKIDGEWSLLPVPTKEELGNLDPRIDTSAAKRVSGDGKVIFGCLGSFAVPIAWIMNEAGEYEVDFFPARYLKATTEDIDNPDKPLYGLSAQYLNMSNNGKYLTMVGKIKDEDGSYLDVPVVYDTEKRDVIIYKGHQKIDANGKGLYPLAISNDGTIIGTIGMPYFDSAGSFIWKAGVTEAETFNNAFPTYAAQLGNAEELGFNIPTAISADGRYILGYTYFCKNHLDANEDAYYVTYTIDTQDATTGVTDANIVNEPVAESFYSIDGRRLGAMSKGLNIVRMSDGTVRKVIKK